MRVWLNRNYIRLLIVVGVLIVLWEFIFFIPRDIPFLWMMLFIVIVYGGWGVFAVWNLRSEQKEALAALEEDCDPGPLLDFARGELRIFDPKGGSRRPFPLTMRLNIAVCCSCLGLDGEARETLAALEPLLPRGSGQLTVLYHCNKAVVCLALGRLEEAAEDLDAAQTLAADAKLPPALRASVALSIESGRVRLRRLQGEAPQTILPFYEDMLGKVGSQRLRVGCHYAMGECLMAMGRATEAREHLTYAADHGNKLYVRAAARDLLAALPS